ncbi:hypothetical protein VPH35_035923 [Triticum aestivum]
MWHKVLRDGRPSAVTLPPACVWCTAPLGPRGRCGEPGSDVRLLRLHKHPWLLAATGHGPHAMAAHDASPRAMAVGEDGGGQHPPRRGKSFDLVRNQMQMRRKAQNPERKVIQFQFRSCTN